MVDDDVIRSNPLAAEAIRMLARSGAIQEQLVRSLQNLSSGDADEDEKEIVRKVREYRRQFNTLTQLLQLGESLIEESGNEPQ
jgi:hypothetical protein